MTEVAEAHNIECGSRVRHAQYGAGVVREVADARAVVECDIAVDGKNIVIVKLDELVIDDGSPFVSREDKSISPASSTAAIELPEHLKNGGSNLGNIAAWLPNFDGDDAPSAQVETPSDSPTTVSPFDNEMPQAKTLLTDFNRRFYVVSNFGGHCVVCEEHPTLDLTCQSFKSFKERFSNWKTEVGTKEVGRGKNKEIVPLVVPSAEYWLDHVYRRQYDRITFAPGEDLGPKVRNLWKGFAVESIKGDCSLYLEHLFSNICKKDSVKYDWLIKWMAYKVQHPGVKCYICIVLRGGEGVGKNVFFNEFGHLFGPHAITVTQKEHISGHFNKHLRACCLLCANEAFYAGDKQHEATLKSLITDETLMVEAKGYDATAESNRLGLVVLSNESWIVPAGIGARRFTVLDCGDEHIQDTPYFKAIADQMKNGGRSALLYFLQNEVDGSDFDERKALITDALSDQQTQSLRGVENLWFECLVRGTLPFSDAGKSFLRAETLIAWARGQGQREWRELKAENLGHLFGNSPRQVRTGMKFVKDKLNGKKGWFIPSLQECRRLWDSTRFRFDWDDPEAEWEPTI
jgi:hypothetical protein